MITLIKNEFFKLKREWFILFLLLLSLIPVLTGGAGALFNNSTNTIQDLFFFMNNQFAMFFPIVNFILVGSLFYQEYKNKTYINWISYGYSKSKLFFSKIMVSFIIGILFAITLLFLFAVLIVILQLMRKITINISLFLSLMFGFALETLIIVFITTCTGAIVINLSRNIIVTSVVGMIYSFVSCFFIGMEKGFIVPGGFAYRVSMYFSDKTTYYDMPVQATIGGCISTIIVFIVLLFISLYIFTHKRKIEN
ncbi:ABC transporter permease [Clostridioides sp. ZZV15-6598]|uniref:ABC transporter permease n=1 Tax=Clostridioides sp. ZZV15-6598 TaxID=2811501 RepID=UPI001D109A77|nr:ABC transporter permease [Clostridioides sp. ZZV15-6598]